MPLDIELVNKHEFLHFLKNTEKFNSSKKHELLTNLTFEERKELKVWQSMNLNIMAYMKKIN